LQSFARNGQLEQEADDGVDDGINARPWRAWPAEFSRRQLGLDAFELIVQAGLMLATLRVVVCACVLAASMRVGL
jgi:hypothetical protein